ncbi:MAG: DUF6390 family protein [bacterium]
MSDKLTKDKIDGVSLCARYSFGPNRLHLCGPDANSEVFAYLKNESFDDGLNNILSQFKNLHPYLQFIASQNNIADPYDPRVVAAYWLGNDLLKNISKQATYKYFTEVRNFNTKFGADFKYVEDKLHMGVFLHHSFHVLNIWHKIGDDKIHESLDSLKKCIITAGKITKISGPYIYARLDELQYHNGKFSLAGATKPKRIIRRLNDEGWLDNIKVGEIITVHWDSPCDTISLEQYKILKSFTNQSIMLANLTI